MMEGYYAFQDHAILHWSDHLEASTPYLLSEKVEDSDDIGSAINNFQEAYGAGEAGREDIPQELKNQCQHLENTEFVENLLLLLSYTRKIRSKDEKMSALGELGVAINKKRSFLEELGTGPSLDAITKVKLEEYYGLNWHKCPRHACFYFHEGFSDPSRRDNHISRHEKPFFCTATSCPRIHLGFSTEKELKKHMIISHPDPAALFPKIKKPPSKHVCDICSKDFTRAHNLKAHKRAHVGERPYGCAFCEKAFARKHDRERHVENLHRDKTESIELASQDTLTGSELDGLAKEELDTRTPTPNPLALVNQIST
jgi:ribosomal protein L34E